jgi:two-component sensor histidine kinase
MSDHAPMPTGDHSPRLPIMPSRRGASRSASPNEGAAPSARDGDETGRLLVREAHHRIANSLQLVMNQLTEGQLQVQDKATADLLDRAVAQVGAIAEMQRALSRSTGKGDADLGRMLAATAACLADLRPGACVSVAVEDVPALQPQQLEALALIVAELVMNALKHAFPGGVAGHVAIGCTATLGELVLTVTDDGVGCGLQGAASSDRLGCGREIVARLVAMVGGAVTTLAVAGGGTTVRVSMPLPAPGSEPPPSGHRRRARVVDGTGPRKLVRAWHGRVPLGNLSSFLSGLLGGRRGQQAKDGARHGWV